MITGSSSVINNIPILGLYETPEEGGGRIVVYGDSNCLDSAHMQRDCFWLLETLLKYVTGSTSPPPFAASNQVRPQPTLLPQHMEGNLQMAVSRILAPWSTYLTGTTCIL